MAIRRYSQHFLIGFWGVKGILDHDGRHQVKQDDTGNAHEQQEDDGCFRRGIDDRPAA